MTEVTLNETIIDKEAYFFENLEWTHGWTSKDVSVVDYVLKDLHSGVLKEKKVVDHILTQFVNNKYAWKRCSEVLEFSVYQKTKYFVLSILKEFIKTKWFSCDQSLDLKKNILAMLLMITKVNELSEEDQKLLDILNSILLQILEYEYPGKWPTFFEEFLSDSKSNTLRCLNSLIILNHMGKKVLGTDNQMSWLKKEFIYKSKPAIFVHIFLSCQFALDTSSNSKLLNYSLETLMQYIIWVPPIYIYKTDFIRLLIHRLNVVRKGCMVMHLLIEIVRICPKKYIIKLVDVFKLYMTLQVQLLSPSGNYKEAYTKSPLYKEKIRCLTMFLCTILKKCGELLRRTDPHSFDNALDYLVSISEIDDPKLVKPCMESFTKILRHLCCDKIEKDICIHQPAMSRLRNLIITKITKPEKTVVKDREGQVIKGQSFYHDPDTVEIYTNMKMILVFLTYLDCADTLKIIIQKLCNEINNCGLSAKNLNSLCCAAVVIRGKSVRVKGFVKRCMSKEEEKNLFWIIIRGLLTLGKLEKARSNKTIIAYNLMHIIGEYAIYLNSRWDVLKGTVLKLFEFMYDNLNNNVTKTLACKTFICIAQKCKKEFIEIQPGETISYFDETLKRMNILLTRLKPQQVFYFYEAIGHIAVARSPCTDEMIIRERIQKLMAVQNEKWELKQPKKSGENCLTPKCIKEIIFIVRINKSVCKGMGFKYKYQLRLIYKKMLRLYLKISYRICEEVKNKGMDAKRPWIKVMITLRKEILNLISVWISSIKKKFQCDMCLKEFMPNILTYVLLDYYNCSAPSLREPEVFSLLTTIVNSLKDSATKKIEIMCSFVLFPTSVIKENCEKLPEVREKFSMFIHAITTHCFEALTEMFSLRPNETFKTIMYLILRSTKYCKKKNATLGLNTLLLLLEKIRNSSIAQQFYQIFYLEIFKSIIFLVANPSHKSGLMYKAHILSHMITLIVQEDIGGLINGAEQAKDNVPNDIYIKFCIASFVQREYEYLNEEQLEFVVNRFFILHEKIPLLVTYLKNFHILCQEFNEKSKQDRAAEKNHV